MQRAHLRKQSFCVFTNILKSIPAISDRLFRQIICWLMNICNWEVCARFQRQWAYKRKSLLMWWETNLVLKRHQRFCSLRAVHKRSPAPLWGKHFPECWSQKPCFTYKILLFSAAIFGVHNWPPYMLFMMIELVVHYLLITHYPLGAFIVVIILFSFVH